MPTSRKNRYPLVALLFFLITLLAAIFYVKPLWDEVSSLSLGRDDKLNQKQTLSDQLTNLQQLQQNLTGSSEITKETTLASIPEKLEQDKLIVDLTDIALKNDIILNGVNFSISTTEIPGQVSKVGVNANLSGSESSLVSFLRGVEANRRKIIVKSITVQSGERATGVARVNFNLSMEAYYQGSI